MLDGVPPGPRRMGGIPQRACENLTKLGGDTRRMASAIAQRRCSQRIEQPVPLPFKQSVKPIVLSSSSHGVGRRSCYQRLPSALRLTPRRDLGH